MLKDLEPGDLVKYGLIPEFVGRLPVLASLEDLDGWIKNSLDQKEFDRYGNDIKESFLNLSLNKKKLIFWANLRGY